ncbi:hypothetical protein LSAT2_003645 [Lamellibrachia satsuma]|nr:hypothetical protein LSAT2_003645 [Lamellibrachia satsuma]
MDNTVDLTREYGDPTHNSTANPQPLLKSREQDRRRQVKDHWFVQFPWLQLDHEKSLFFCRWCLAANRINTMTRGKSTQMPKKHYFQQHELHSEHQSAAQQFWSCSRGSQLHGSGSQLHDTASQLHSSGSQLHDSANQLHGSGSQLHGSGSHLHDTASQLHSSGSQLHDSANQLHGSGSQLQDSASQLHDSGSQLHDSASQLHGSDSQLHGSGSQLHGSGSQLYDSASQLRGSGRQLCGSGGGYATTSTPPLQLDVEPSAASGNCPDTVMMGHSSGFEQSYDPMQSAQPISTISESYHVSVNNQNAAVAAPSQNLAVDSQNIAVDSHNLTVDSQNLAVDSQNLAVDSQNLTVDSQNLAVDSQNLTVDSQNLTVDSQNFAVDSQNLSTDVTMASPNASWNYGFNGNVIMAVPAIDQSAIITSNFGLLDASVTPKGTRKIKPSWFTAFPWLVMDGARQLFFCQYCCAANRRNVFTEGRTTSNPKKDHFYKHSQTADHSSAALWYQDNCANVPTTGVSSGENSVQHIEGRSEFVSGTDSGGGVLFVKVKQEVMSSDEVGNVTEDVDSQAPRETGAAATCKTESYTEEIRHTSVGLVDSVNKQPDNNTHPTSVGWHYDASSIAQFLHDFVWLEYSHQGLLECTACVNASKQNSFSYGQHPGSVTHKRLVMHERLPGHVDAIYGLGCTLQKDTSAMGDDKHETLVKSKVLQEHIYRQPRIKSTSNGGGDDVAMVTDSRSEVTVCCEDESGDAECEMASTTDDGGALPVIIDMSTLEDKPAAVRCMLTAGWGQRMGQRSFRPAWFFQFPWLEYDVASNRFRCKCCAVYSSVSNFAIGKLVSVPKRHTFVSHEVSDGHKMALKAYNADARNEPLGSGVDDLGDATDLLREAEGYTEQRWHQQFPWIQLDFDQMDLHCRVCRSSDTPAACESPLAEGVPLGSVCRGELEAHGKWDVHRKAESSALEEKQLPSSSPVATPVVMETRNESLSCAVDQPRIETTENTCCVCRDQPRIETAENTCCVCRDQPRIETTENTCCVCRDQPRIETTENTCCVCRDQPRIETTENTWMTNFWQLANQLRHLDVLCDVTLTVAPHSDKCQQHEFRAHRLMLMCASDQFKANLASGKDHFHFDGVSAAGMKAVLDFIYGQPVHGTHSEYMEYYNAATALGVLPARTAFSRVLRDNDNRPADHKRSGAVLRDNDNRPADHKRSGAVLQDMNNDNRPADHKRSGAVLRDMNNDNRPADHKRSGAVLRDMNNDNRRADHKRSGAVLQDMNNDNRPADHKRSGAVLRDMNNDNRPADHKCSGTVLRDIDNDNRPADHKRSGAVLRDMNNDNRPADHKPSGAVITKQGDSDHTNCAKIVKKSNVIAAIGQSERLLPRGRQTPIGKQVVHNFSSSSILQKTISACKHPPRVLPVNGCRPQQIGQLHDDNPQSSTSNPSCYRCAKPKCKRKFTRHMDLARHLAYAHTVQKRHCCNWCNKKFAWRSSLQAHEAGHVTASAPTVT